ncbi:MULTISPECIES: EexN family lipoprotein [unclassified Sphingomonas]|uniref:EexN family lipoprotein n=1 Tax=unclassified Sphingomonas TaxID=196159 RepID=UPI0022699E43|nr:MULTISPECIES: EexN family lipoprotein [unclassified Sphingomonas]
MTMQPLPQITLLVASGSAVPGGVMKKMTLVALTFGLAVCACSSSKTVEYYKGHQDALQKRLDECVAYGEDSQDCRNVRQAYSELHHLPAR